MSISRRTRGFTLVEAMISMAIFGIVAAGVAALIDSAASTSNVVSGKTRVHLEAERILKTIQLELQTTGVAQGNFVLSPNPAVSAPGSIWEMRYNKLIAGQPIFTGDPAAIPWSPETFILRYEPAEAWSGAAAGVDSDGDYLIDEHRLVLLQDPGAGAPGPQIAVISDNITAFEVQMESAGLARPRLKLTLTMDWLLRGTVKNRSEITDHRNPGLVIGPWARHTADIWITLSN